MTCFCRKSDGDREAPEFFDEEIVQIENDQAENFDSLTNRESFIETNPLAEDEIRFAREKRLLELKSFSVLREIASYFFFIGFLYLATFSNLSNDNFHQVQHFKRFFVGPNRHKIDFTRVSSLTQRNLNNFNFYIKLIFLIAIHFGVDEENSTTVAFMNYY